MSGRIEVEGLSKLYPRYHADKPMTIQEIFSRGIGRMRPAELFPALDDVSFVVEPGRIVGIVGLNGAGKSTLLRLVAGVGRPDEGRVRVHGRVGAILDLGVGFHPELTGRENVFVSGVTSGLTRREVAERFDEIVAFAEVGDFLDNPLRTFSLGMQLRLAFAVASHIEPEVLLIDELLTVGDLPFQQKCVARLAQFKDAGCTGLFVSHAPTLVKDLCNDAIWLDHGRIVEKGPADEVVDRFLAASLAPSPDAASASGG